MILGSDLPLKNRADKMQSRERSFSFPKIAKKCHFGQLEIYPQIHLQFTLEILINAHACVCIYIYIRTYTYTYGQ